MSQLLGVVRLAVPGHDQPDDELPDPGRPDRPDDELPPGVEGDVLLDLSVEDISFGGNVNIAGAAYPQFNQRTVTTKLRLRDGESKGQILAFLASRYGDGILLRPEASGVAGLVWVLPVALGLLAIAGVIAALRRWRVPPGAPPVTDEDRARVEAALQS